MTASFPSNEARYRILKYLAEHPNATQRQLASELGISVGKVNYCVRALMEKGWLKVQNFTNSSHKSAYSYVLTPKGIEEKMSVTYAFLRRKVSEFDLIRKEIEELTAEVGAFEAERDAVR